VLRLIWSVAADPKPQPNKNVCNKTSLPEYRLHASAAVVSMDTLKSSGADTLRHLEDLLTEARHLRERIAAALCLQDERPFFPERRDHYEPHEPDRRRHE